MIVADTNLIAYVRLQGVHTPAAEAVFRKDPDWCAPMLWRSEFRNVLVLHLRKRLVDLATALQVMSDAEAHLSSHEYSVPAEPVLRLAVSSKCSACDCEFIALAEGLGIPLVTNDKRILGEFPKIAVSPAAFVASP